MSQNGICELPSPPPHNIYFTIIFVDGIGCVRLNRIVPFVVIYNTNTLNNSHKHNKTSCGRGWFPTKMLLVSCEKEIVRHRVFPDPNSVFSQYCSQWDPFFCIYFTIKATDLLA